jgi:YidC/Oxa1 family membrane protein insertase
MSKNMPADAMSGPYAQQQKMLLYVLPVAFAAGGVAFPIGVLVYWTTTNIWTMGQQFYVIRRNPAPGTPAFDAKVARDRAKGRTTELQQELAVEEAHGDAHHPPEQRQRQQPKRQSREKRKKAGGQPRPATQPDPDDEGKSA